MGRLDTPISFKSIALKLNSVQCYIQDTTFEKNLPFHV